MMALFVDAGSFSKAMNYSDDEPGDSITGHALIGLAKHSLLLDGFVASGKKSLMRDHWSQAPGPGIIFAPSAFGAELFCWAHGAPNITLDRFTSIEVEEPLPEVVLPQCVEQPTFDFRETE